MINLGLPMTNAKCSRLDISSDGLASEHLDEPWRRRMGVDSYLDVVVRQSTGLPQVAFWRK